MSSTIIVSWKLQVPKWQDAQRQIWLDDSTERANVLSVEPSGRYARSIIQLVSRRLAGLPCSSRSLARYIFAHEQKVSVYSTRR